MNRAIPTSNKLISKKIDERNRQIHLNKLQGIKSSIPREPSGGFVHLKSNKKRHQQYEDKLTEIERENRILLEKLTHIMKNSNSQQEKSQPRSLNRDMRKKELVKITIENQAFLQRLKDKKSNYNRYMWEDERRKNERYLKNISEYPMALYSTTTKTPKSPDEIRRPQTFHDGKIGEEKFGFNSIYPNERYESAHMMHERGELQKRNNKKLDPMTSMSNQKEILYQTRKKVGFSNFLIHIYNQNGSFNILASNNDRADFKTFSVPQSEGEKILQTYEDNYEQLINKLRFQGNKILIEDYEYYEEISNRKENLRPKTGTINEDGIIEIQDDNDENDSFEQSENKVQLKSSESLEDEKLKTFPKKPSDKKGEQIKDYHAHRFDKGPNTQHTENHSIIAELSQKEESESQAKVEIGESFQKIRSRENPSSEKKEEEDLEEIESEEDNN